LKKALLLMVAFVIATVTLASADIITGVTVRTGNDGADWSQLGPDGTPVSTGFTLSSTGGIGITGSFAGGGDGAVLQQGVDWGGNFAAGDDLLWTNSPGQGPLVLAFSSGVYQAGVQIQADYVGAFAATIDAYNGSTWLGTFSENGVSNGNGDNSAIYLGIQDLSGRNINKVVIGLSSCTQDCGDFAVNQLSLTTPEPGTLVLLASGMLGLAGAVRRRVA